MRKIFSCIVIFLLISACQPHTCSQEMLLYIALDGKGDFNIYLNDLAGEEQQMTSNPSWDYAPHWNSVSQSFTYYAYVDGTFQILRKNLHGEDLDPNIQGLTEYNLSPNNQMIVSEVSMGDHRKLMILDLKGMDSLDITPANSYNGRAQWSPNSQQIVYISDREGNNEVYLYDVRHRTTQRLTTNETSEKYLSWAPDSERVLYSTEYYEEGQPDRNDLFILNTRTMKTTQITDNPYEDSEVAWSPSGDWIAFHSKRDTIDHIFVMRPDGSEVRQVTTALKYHGEPDWVVVEASCQ